jgi:hypothetical protein
MGNPPVDELPTIALATVIVVDRRLPGRVN